MAKRRASRISNMTRGPKKPTKNKTIKSRAIGQSKRKSASVRKVKEARRRKEIVLEILEEIRSTESRTKSPKARQDKTRKTVRSETRAGGIYALAAEPRIESALISRPVTLLRKAPSTIGRFGPDVSKKRVVMKPISLMQTGIPGFDEMCGGGIEERSIVLINGDAGSGKSIFGLQFLYEGAKKGEAALYISFGESRESIYSRMLEFGMDFQELEDKKLFFFVEYQPHEVAKIIQENSGMIYDIVKSYNIKRVVMDTITPYLTQFTDPFNARFALVKLFNVFRKFNVTTVLLNEWSSHLPLHQSAAIAEFLADGVVYLIHARSTDGVQVRGVEIWKMLGVDHTEVARPFAFTRKGITIYPNEKLFLGHDNKQRR